MALQSDATSNPPDDGLSHDPVIDMLRKRAKEQMKDEEAEIDEQYKLVEVNPAEGESMSDAVTRRVREHVAGNAIANFAAGYLLRRVEEEQLYAPKYASFEKYLVAEFPEVDPDWARVLMTIAYEFTLAQVKRWGISALNELRKLRQEAFPDVPAYLLLEERHSFKDASGAECVLDMQVDHSVRTLKALVVAAKRAKRAHDGNPDRLSVAAARLQDAFNAATAGVKGVEWSLEERRERVNLELHGEAQLLIDVIARVAAASR